MHTNNSKLIILAAGQDKNLSTKTPKCLQCIDNKTVLDNFINIAKENAEIDICIVGGYEILQIMERYPNLHYFYNKKWEDTKSLYSLSLTFNQLNTNSFISYSDVMHSDESFNLINKSKINIFYDSLWAQRYENRDVENLEKIYDKNDSFLGEFSGLLYIPKNEISVIEQLSASILAKNIKSTLLDLIKLLIKKDNINYIDLSGNWAELDSIQDIEHFKFGTKAETLNNLKAKLKKSEVLDQFTFTVGEYTSFSKKIISKIQNNLRSKLLVVRSSALNEDTENSSMAGNYESILKVIKDDNDILNKAIQTVIESYKKNNQEQDENNQILVQPYLSDVTMSGVVFSKNLQTSSPYYTVNYDNSSDTESVTSGNGDNLNTFICYNEFTSEIENNNLSVLIEAVKEIESVTKYDAIDIEFAFIENKLYILQVRPIAAKKDTITVSSKAVSIELNNIKSFLDEQSIALQGNKKAYGIMPDWNPAEIVGINPRPLSFDIYKYIITDNIWAKSRNDLGYRDVENCVGLVSFAGKPYVDIQMSFNTFIPNTLSDKISRKLVDNFISKLEKNPENHDKVEFLVAITAYDFGFNKKMNELISEGFTNEECISIKESYKELTQNIILEKTTSIDKEISKTVLLTKKRDEILNSNMNDIDKIYNILEDCKKYGTLPFSNLARFGFIGSIFLKSLLLNCTIEQKEYDNFFQSIHTVAKDFMEDFNLLINGTLSKDKFIENYGHLRPGTYDITSLSYKDAFDDYIDFNSIGHSNLDSNIFQFSKETKNEIAKEIIAHNLSFSVEELISFIIKSTEAREKAKFEFTKNLSAVLELIYNIGKDIGLDRDSLSYLNLDELLKCTNSSSRINFYENIEKNIRNNRQKFLITSAIQLPDLIFSSKDIDMFFYPSLKPNFVSHHTLSAKTVFLENNNTLSIDNKIVLIENADPGFDWIFSHNIKGLVTKYGGAASHMAIRCAEFDLPAAIGCGDKIFNDLIKFNKINLDCVNHKIKGIT